MKISYSKILSIIFHATLLLLLINVKNPPSISPTRSNGVTVSLISDDQIPNVATTATKQPILTNFNSTMPNDINLKPEKPTPTITQQTKIAKQPQLLQSNPLTHKPLTKISQNKKIIQTPYVDEILKQIPTSKANGNSHNLATGGNKNGTASNNNLQIDSYADQVISLLRPYITIPDNIDSQATTVIQITLLPNLTIYQQKTIKSSGNLEYDTSILLALQKISHFPKLPPNANFNNYRTLILVFKPD